MLEVPTLLIADNPYYEQKAAGLREDFGLPPAFVPTATADSVAAAGAVTAVLLDRDHGDELRRGLASGVERQRRRRAGTELELLGRLGAAAAAALGGQIESQVERLRQRSAEPAALQAQLSALHTELEGLQQAGGEPRLEAELRAQAAEANATTAHRELAAVLQSRSWRLLAPLRRLRALLRRG